MITKHKNQPKKVALITLCLIFVALHITTLALLWKTSDELGQQINNLPYALKDDAMDKQPLIEPAAKRAYLTGLGLYLPLNTTSASLSYVVTDESGGGTLDIAFRSDENFLSAPGEQKSDCGTLARVEIGATTSQPTANERAQTPFKLADGRSVYSYLPKATEQCKNTYFVTPEKMYETVRKLQSY